MEATTKKKFQFPDVYALIFILCCLAMVLTWIIPAGTFERVTEGTLTKVVAGTFQHVDSSPQTPWAMLQAIYQGFINSAGTIFLIFFCGASVAMVEESHALSDFFTWLARKLKRQGDAGHRHPDVWPGSGQRSRCFRKHRCGSDAHGHRDVQRHRRRRLPGFPHHLLRPTERFLHRLCKPQHPWRRAQTMAEIPIFSGTNVRVVCCLANITFRTSSPCCTTAASAKTPPRA